MIEIDGHLATGGGQILRSALTLSAGLGKPCEIRSIRANRPRPGLRPQHLAAVRAAALCSQAKVSGAFEGSEELRFEPNAIAPGQYEFDIGAAGSAVLVLQTVAPILARASEPSGVCILGGTHVPRSPTYDFLKRAWAPELERIGYTLHCELRRAGYSERGGGELRARVGPLGPGRQYQADRRGRLERVAGTSVASNLKGDVARRQGAASKGLLWESQRLDSTWTIECPRGASPGSYVQVELVFERSRAAFGALGTRGVRPEVLGERVARGALRFLDGTAAVDPLLADQLVVPLALSRHGGRVATSELTEHLETVVAVARAFGVEISTWGQRGLTGGYEVSVLDPPERAA